MFYKNDVHAFFLDFSEDIEINNTQLKAIVNNDSAESNIFSNNISGYTLSLTVKTDDISDIDVKQFDLVKYNSNSYKIIKIKYDYSGLSELFLEEVY